MSITPIPRLRDDAVVRPFDDRSPRARYVVALDGHHFVVTPTVAAILEESRELRVGEHELATLAARVTLRLGREIPQRHIEALLHRHAPRLFFETCGSRSPDESPIKCRHLLFSGQRLKPALVLLGPLFNLRAAIAICTAIFLIDAAVATHLWQHGAATAEARDHAIGFALTLVGVFLHELGHLSSCHRFGGHHGGIGAGIYWCLPAFYAEVHGAWLLPRRERAAVDVGGIYLQSSFVALLGVLYLLHPLPALLVAIALSSFLMLHTLNPVLKFDGYWLLCDLAGIHNLHRTLRDLARRIISGCCPNRAELSLLAAFVLLACAYFAYVLVMLGNGLGGAAAALRFAWRAADGSAMSSVGILGRAGVLALMLVTASGIAMLLARAARDVFCRTPNPAMSTERNSQ